MAVVLPPPPPKEGHTEHFRGIINSRGGGGQNQLVGAAGIKWGRGGGGINCKPKVSLLNRSVCAN